MRLLSRVNVKTIIASATLFLGNFTMASCDIFPVPWASDSIVTAENSRSFGEQRGAPGNLYFAAIDFCHVGSVTDPATGETVDLYASCQEDGFEQNLNIA